MYLLEGGEADARRPLGGPAGQAMEEAGAERGEDDGVDGGAEAGGLDYALAVPRDGLAVEAEGEDPKRYSALWVSIPREIEGCDSYRLFVAEPTCSPRKPIGSSAVSVSHAVDGNHMLEKGFLRSVRAVVGHPGVPAAISIPGAAPLRGPWFGAD